MLIDQSYFIGGLNIPNLTGVGMVPAANVGTLNWFIATYEPEYLRLVLGKTLYNALIAGLLVVPIPSKWQTLRAKLIDSTNKISPIASYVFYHIERDKITSTTSMGQASGKAENADMNVNSDKMCQPYNCSIRIGIEIRQWLSENGTTYPEYTTSELDELHTINNFGI